MKKRNFKNDIFGYSIIEIIVYLAIFAVMSVLVINSFITVLSSFNVTSFNRKLLESGTVSMERMTREIRQAESIDASSTSNSLVLQVSSGYMCFKRTDDGNLNFSTGSTTSCTISQGDLLDDDVSLTSIAFRKITTTESQAVKIEMVLEYNEGTTTRSENFYNTTLLRGAY